ncbi:aquaporin NIP3-2-like [Panicum miliaceum]|uniref:Aquaporin NIP3-2-like n=1 Tax=Panicum miliaceum TaxID=4540 RepID=A0A3L6RGS6_PANMI|nr:aquaporin NIP3-2-like [Panicum miliaceum]
MAAFGYHPGAQLAPYVAAQLLGSTTAVFAAKAVYGPANLGAAGALVVEFITTFVLLFVISDHHRPRHRSESMGTGAAVMMSALISAESTGASMNPARTLGPAIASGTYTKIWIYMVAPPLGAIAPELEPMLRK